MRQTTQTAGPKEAQTEEPACSSTVKEDSREVILQLRPKDQQGMHSEKKGEGKASEGRSVLHSAEGTACVKACTE